MIIALTAPDSGVMAGKVRRARRRQRKALRQMRKQQKVTNRMYRKNTRVERGTDFAATNNAKIGDMVTGLVDKAGSMLQSYLSPQSSMPGMSGTRLIYNMGSSVEAAQAAVAAHQADVADSLGIAPEEEEEEAAPAVPPWAIPAAIGGVVLLLVMRR